MVQAGNKAKHLSSVNHTTKTNRFKNLWLQRARNFNNQIWNEGIAHSMHQNCPFYIQWKDLGTNQWRRYGSPLGPALADKLMIRLKKAILSDIYILYVTFWRRCADNTSSFLKVGSIKYILFSLNSFSEKYNLHLKLRAIVHYHL